MNGRTCLVVALPTDRASAIGFFTNPRAGSFAEEWAVSNPQCNGPRELGDAYQRNFLSVLGRTTLELRRLGVVYLPNAKFCDLIKAFEIFDLILLLAHHVQNDLSIAGEIELWDRTISVNELANIAPTKSSAVVHLGVCHSTHLIPALKARNQEVRVIASQLTVDPVFFILQSLNTLQYCEAKRVDYVSALVDTRLAIVNSMKNN
jgi:hypothetical protein